MRTRNYWVALGGVFCALLAECGANFECLPVGTATGEDGHQYIIGTQCVTDIHTAFGVEEVANGASISCLLVPSEDTTGLLYFASADVFLAAKDYWSTYLPLVAFNEQLATVSLAGALNQPHPIESKLFLAVSPSLCPTMVARLNVFTRPPTTSRPTPVPTPSTPSPTPQRHAWSGELTGTFSPTIYPTAPTNAPTASPSALPTTIPTSTPTNTPTTTHPTAPTSPSTHSPTVSPTLPRISHKVGHITMLTTAGVTALVVACYVAVICVPHKKTTHYTTLPSTEEDVGEHM